MINTKLQEQVLSEVFAPRNCKKNYYNNYINNITTDTNTPNNETVNNTINTMAQGVRRRCSDSLTEHTVADLKQFRCHSGTALSSSKKCVSADNLKISKRSNSMDNHKGHEETIFEMEIANNASSAPTAPNNIHHQRTTSVENIIIEPDDCTIVSKYILLEDLTRKLRKPCVLDLKMGTRQYGVDALDTKQSSQRKKCFQTTSRLLGCRICGLKIWDVGEQKFLTRDKYFGRRVKIGWQFARILARFLYNGVYVSSIIKQIPKLIYDLDKLQKCILNLKGYRLYGASLLLKYDGEAKEEQQQQQVHDGNAVDEDDDEDNDFDICRLHLIDFAQCVIKEDVIENFNNLKIPPSTSLEYEDRGFVRGLKSLKFYMLHLWKYLTNDHPLIFKKEEMAQYLRDNKDNCYKNWDWLDEFDKEDELQFDDLESPLRKKWRKYELIFDIEPHHNIDEEVSE
ncbi:uncharacterized protein SCODWIG_02710 [Saccharomycodes ludwigii]|uniref:Kinase n=2 Tax=Saccharomycodes ludwigii TaxID=36035 RepID=A0A376B8Q4_9ASCO|nr:uncharacterized protein SCODWIG_02710 [Saccharomycodes ludwigii]